jgi:hypothetical protein
LVERRVLVARADVAFLRYVLEGHDGMALMHGDGSGAISLFAPESQSRALDALISDLEAEGLLVHMR